MAAFIPMLKEYLASASLLLETFLANCLLASLADSFLSPCSLQSRSRHNRRPSSTRSPSSPRTTRRLYLLSHNRSIRLRPLLQGRDGCDSFWNGSDIGGVRA